MEYFLNNREFIKNLKLNTGTSSAPTYTAVCTASEIALETELETQDFYVFCDAIQRAIVTGIAITLSTTIKLNMGNTASVTLLNKIKTAMVDGTVAQFNNETCKFDLLTGIENDVLEYTTLTCPCTMNISDLGGAAEDVAEYSLELIINGKATTASE